MKPPEDRPETVVWVLSTLSLGNGTAACVALEASTRPARRIRSDLNVIEHVSRWWLGKTTPPPVCPGVSQRNGSKRGAAAPVESARRRTASSKLRPLGGLGAALGGYILTVCCGSARSFPPA